MNSLSGFPASPLTSTNHALPPLRVAFIKLQVEARVVSLQWLSITAGMETKLFTMVVSGHYCPAHPSGPSARWSLPPSPCSSHTGTPTAGAPGFQHRRPRAELPPPLWLSLNTQSLAQRLACSQCSLSTCLVTQEVFVFFNTMNLHYTMNETDWKGLNTSGYLSRRIFPAVVAASPEHDSCCFAYHF